MSWSGRNMTASIEPAKRGGIDDLPIVGEAASAERQGLYSTV